MLVIRDSISYFILKKSSLIDEYFAQSNRKWISSSISVLQTRQILSHLEILSYLPVSMLSLWLLSLSFTSVFSCSGRGWGGGGGGRGRGPVLIYFFPKLWLAWSCFSINHLRVNNNISSLSTTRTTTWNLPGPSGTRDCTNTVSLAPLPPLLCRLILT